MKKEKMIKFLEETKTILNGRNFEDELSRKEKRVIFDAFMALNAKFKYDADEDWADVFTELGKLRIDFNANADYANAETIRKHIDGMEININGDDATIEAAINYLKSTNDIIPLAILNTSILTTAGVYKLEDISLDRAKKLVSENEIDSAVGHASAAQIMTALLGEEIPVNRQMFMQQPGQDALVFKLNGRPAEGKILTAEEIERIGYKFQLLQRLA